jgi:hypothetical protein
LIAKALVALVMLPFGFGRERFVYRWAAAEFEALNASRQPSQGAVRLMICQAIF